MGNMVLKEWNMKSIVSMTIVMVFCIQMALSIEAEEKKPFTCTKLEVTHEALLDTLRKHVSESLDVKFWALAISRFRYEGAIAYLSMLQSTEYIVSNRCPIGMVPVYSDKTVGLQGVVEIEDDVVGVFCQASVDGLLEAYGTYKADSNFSDTTDCRKRVWVFVIREDKVSLVDSYDAEDRY